MGLLIFAWGPIGKRIDAECPQTLENGFSNGGAWSAAKVSGTIGLRQESKKVDAPQGRETGEPFLQSRSHLICSRQCNVVCDFLVCSHADKRAAEVRPLGFAQGQ